MNYWTIVAYVIKNLYIPFLRGIVWTKMKDIIKLIPIQCEREFSLELIQSKLWLTHIRNVLKITITD